MQHTRPLAALAAVFLLTACLPDIPAEMPPTDGQTLSQLQLQQAEIPLRAAWIPWFICDRLFASGDADTARTAVSEYIRRLAEQEINTVFVHVCAFGESSYPSAYYPQSPGTHGLDGIQIFSEVCRKQGISFHAWLNPLRLQNQAYMDEQCGNSVLCTWYRDEEQRAGKLSMWEKRWYLNPAAGSTGDFLAGVVTEIMQSYHPDGIHIDDYFYPTTLTAFDKEDFAASGAGDLAVWRRENITKLVRRMGEAVHAADETAVFSVSPQGTLVANVQELYADVPLWMQEGLMDWVIPQVYFGYENQYAPFAETCRKWVSLPRAEGVKLAVGLGAYKVGQPDEHAGTGQNEWVQDPELLQKQTRDILGDPAMWGVAFYHADSLLGE